MSRPVINWDVLRELTMPKLPPRPEPGGENMWDKHADMYNMMAGMERGYTFNQINCFPIAATDTVLDIGCGPGRISVLMAGRAGRVTSLDSSPKMLAHCLNNAKTAGRDNLEGRLIDWNDDEALKEIPPHDIVIASRSVGMYDVLKLSRFAKKYCVMVCWANDDCIPDILNELFAGTSGAMNGPGGRPPAPAPAPEQEQEHDRRLGYNVTWNLVYDLGFDPNINIVPDGFTKDFASREEAYAYLRQLRPLRDDELPVFAANVDKHLTDQPGGGVTFRRETTSFVMWWQPKPVAELTLY